MYTHIIVASPEDELTTLELQECFTSAIYGKSLKEVKEIISKHKSSELYSIVEYCKAINHGKIEDLESKFLFPFYIKDRPDIDKRVLLDLLYSPYVNIDSNIVAKWLVEEKPSLVNCVHPAIISTITKGIVNVDSVDMDNFTHNLTNDLIPLVKVGNHDFTSAEYEIIKSKYDIISDTYTDKDVNVEFAPFLKHIGQSPIMDIKFVKPGTKEVVVHLLATRKEFEGNNIYILGFDSTRDFSLEMKKDYGKSYDTPALIFNPDGLGNLDQLHNIIYSV